MCATEAPHVLVDEPVILGRAFPAHAADQAKGLHAQLHAGSRHCSTADAELHTLVIANVLVMIENALFKALADPTRRHIFEKLAEGGQHASALREGMAISLRCPSTWRCCAMPGW